MADLGKAYVQIVPSAQGISGKIEEVLTPEADKAGKSAGDSVGKQLGSFAKKAIIGLGVGKAISDSISNGMEFETSMAKASTLFSGTSDELNQLQSDILRISSETGVAASQLAEAAYSAESASVPMGNLGDMIEQSAKLATAGYTDIDTALSATAKTMNAYGMVSEDVNATNAAMEKVQKILIQTQNKGITTVGELGASLANVTPTAAAAGVGFEQVGAALAVMTAQGTPTAQATTQLRSAIAELEKNGTKASSALKKAAAGTEYAGMTFTEMMDSGADLGDVMGMLQTYADKTGVSMLDLWSSVEGGNAAMAIAKDVSVFDEDLMAMSTGADVVGEAYGTMADTVDNQMSRISQSLTNIGIEAFSGVAGTLTTVLNGALTVIRNIQPALSTLGSAFGNLFGAAARVIGKMLGLKEGFSGADVASSLLTTVINAVSTAINFLADHAGTLIPIIAGVAGAIGAVNIAMAVMNTNPIILAITAVVAAITLCITHWDLIKETVISVGSSIMSAVSSAWGTVTSVISGAVSAAAEFIGPIWIEIQTTASTVWDSISSTAETVWNAIGTFISDPIGTAKAAVNEILGVFGTDLTTVWNTIQSTADAAWKAIGGFISDPIGTAKAAVNEILGIFGTDLATVWNTIQSTADAAWQAIGGFISDPIGTAKAAVSEALGLLGVDAAAAWNTIQSAADTAWKAIGGFISDPIGTAKATVSGALGLLGVDLTSVWSSIQSAADSAWSAIGTFMSDPIGTAQTTIESVADTLGIDLTSVWSTIQTAASTAWDAIGTFMSDPIGTAKTGIGTAIASISTAMDTAWEGIKTAASDAWDAVGTFISDPIGTAKTAIGTAVSTLTTTLSSAWDSIKNTASTVWTNIKTKITSPITSAKTTISGIIDKIKGFFPFNIGKILNLKIPKISISGGSPPWGIAGKGSLPSFSVNWEAQALKNPFMFTGATLFGAGEAGDEILYGRDALMRDIREAAGNGSPTNTFNITVDGAENPEEFADRLVRQLKLDLRTA